MKKTILAFIMTGMFLGALPAQRITVTSPNGSPWCLNAPTPYMITWTVSGNMQNTVAIRLRTAGSPESAPAALVIVNGTPNDGSYPWMIPASVAPGDYFIRVRTDDSTVIGDSINFKLKPCLPSINVTSPFGAEWKAGTTHAITWTKSGAMQNAVSIRLRYAGSGEGDAPALIIADGTANDGFFSWTIPDSVAPRDYFIRIRTDDSAVIGDSGVFPISGQSSAAITILYPVNTVGWDLGTTQTIKWASSGATGNQVRIELKDPAMIHTVSVIANSAPNSGSYSWHIPDDFMEDDYRIRVSSLSNMNVFGDSAVVGIRYLHCGRLDSLSQTSGFPGDSFTMSGEWPFRQGSRCPRIFAGSETNYMLEVLSWSTEAIQVKIPMGINPGPSHVNLRCVCDNPIASSGALSFEVLARPTDFTVSILEYADGKLKVRVTNQGTAYYCPFDIKLTVRDLDHARATIFPATLFKEHEQKTFSLLFPAWPQGKDCLECTVMFDSMGRVAETNELNNTVTQNVCRNAGN